MTNQNEIEENGWPTEITNSISMRFRHIRGGEFLMGDETGAMDQAAPPHLVEISRPFFISVFPVTQEEYEFMMQVNPSYIVVGRNNPVEDVSWYDAVEFCERLSALPAERAAGRVYRLPTEAEWEFACRAGTTTAYSFGDEAAALHEYAWFLHNSGGETHPVGQKLPNEWGLHDMIGNTWEWVHDWFASYPSGPLVDPTGPKWGLRRTRRGGAWYLEPEYSTSSFRVGGNPGRKYDSTGFRLAMNLTELSESRESFPIKVHGHD